MATLVNGNLLKNTKLASSKTTALEMMLRMLSASRNGSMQEPQSLVGVVEPPQTRSACYMGLFEEGELLQARTRSTMKDQNRARKQALDRTLLSL